MALLKWPGLIDVHVHLREPGAVYKEDFFTGGRSAVKGGFVQVLDMPNNPISTISVGRLDQKIRLSKKKSVCKIGFHFGTNGKNLKDFSKVWGNPKVFGLKVYCNHTTGEMLIEDINLLTSVFEAWKSKKPILVHAEGVQLAAAIGLAHLYGRHLHVCHITQSVEVEMVRLAKSRGQKISAGVCPHHLYLTGESRERLGGFAMMKPPLGTKRDKKALWEGLMDGTIDMVESDHAPHTKKEKQSSCPAFGVPGLETTLGLMLLAVKERKCSLRQVKKWLYFNPKKVFNIPDQEETYIWLDPGKSFVFEAGGAETKCDWSPFDKMRLYGKVEKVVISGKEVYADDTFL